MFPNNKTFCAFREQLQARDVSMRVLWSAKSDPRQKYDDVALVSFVGNGFSPSESTAVIRNYEDPRKPDDVGAGFGLWFESDTSDIAKDVERISKPRNR